MSSAILSQLLRKDPIVVTGIGCVSAAGCSPDELWSNLLIGATPCEWLNGDRSRPVYPIHTEIDAASIYRPAHKMDRSVQLALLAARQAVESAGIDSDLQRERTGVFVGTSRGPIGKWREAMSIEPGRRPLPSLAVDTPMSSISGALSLAFKLAGPATTVSATCASGAYAIIGGAEQLLLGQVDHALVGAADSTLLPEVLDQMASAGMLGVGEDPEKICKPFDKKRSGMALGETAAFLMIERFSTANERGARILGYLRGWATSTDTNGRTIHQMDGARLVENMNSALAVANLVPNDIDLINAHGTGTVLNDKMELAAYETFAKIRSSKLPVHSNKATTGHCLGATAALEAVISLLAIQHHTIIHTTNLATPESTRFVELPQASRISKNVDNVLSNSLGFWGNQASLIFGRSVGK